MAVANAATHHIGSPSMQNPTRAAVNRADAIISSAFILASLSRAHPVE